MLKNKKINQLNEKSLIFLKPSLTDWCHHTLQVFLSVQSPLHRRHIMNVGEVRIAEDSDFALLKVSLPTLCVGIYRNCINSILRLVVVYTLGLESIFGMIFLI